MNAAVIFAGILGSIIGAIVPLWLYDRRDLANARAEIARLTATKQGLDSVGRFVSKGVGE